MPDWLQLTINLWFLITVCRLAWGARKLLFTNRDGHCGRMDHWLNNPRIIGPGVASK